MRKSFAIEKSCVLTLKGSMVIGIYPQGKFYPLYKIAEYRGKNVPYKTIERFVCNKEIT